MERIQVSVFLHHPVTAFSIQNEHCEFLKQHYPHCDFHICTSTRDFVEKLPQTDIAVTWRFKKEWYAISVKLRFILTPAAGHDWIDEDPDLRIPTFFGTFHGRFMAESICAMMGYFNRLHVAHQSRKRKNWDRESFSRSISMRNSMVFIVGYGKIAEYLTSYLVPYQCTCIGMNRSGSIKNRLNHSVRIIGQEDFLHTLAGADHVVNLLPAGRETDHFFTLEHFRIMKRDAIFYAFGRGNSYCEDELVSALNLGYIKGAGLDVFNTEPLDPSSVLWNMENVLITPHASCIFKEYIEEFFMTDFRQHMIES